MFTVAETDIESLSPDNLRELIARLAQAEADHQGYSSTVVRWGGHGNAADGGVDVTLCHLITFVREFKAPMLPRARTVFQSKAEDLPPKEITAEMRPEGKLRPFFQQLAIDKGAYLIVSSKGTVSDKFLKERVSAMRAALYDLPNSGDIHIDFIDRCQLKDWINSYPGVILWCKQVRGQSYTGWRPFGNWSNSSEVDGASYISDRRARFGLPGSTRLVAASAAIAYLRETLSQNRKSVRLVGMSGVGKTRLVQSLFDQSITVGTPLDTALAVYADFGLDLSPSPTSLATEFMTTGKRAILIVDNCSGRTHKELTEICVAVKSQLSVITIEYDVREDLMEHTEVMTMEPGSNWVIETLIERRHPNLQPGVGRMIAAVSGGNARIALAIAPTVTGEDSISSLRDQDLFERLFLQRHINDQQLLRTAKVCSLVYSFDVETEDGPEAQMPILAALGHR